MKHKMQMSIRNVGRRVGEPAFGPWEDILDDAGNLVLVESAEVALLKQEDKEFEDFIHMRYIPVVVGE